MTLDRSNIPNEYRFAKPVHAGLVYVDSDNLDYALFLYKLLEERQAEQSISHKRMPRFSEHVAFVRGRPYLAWYIITSAEAERVGAVYITRRRELGLSILRAHQRKGHGGAAVREVMRIHAAGDEPFLANINPKNEASIAFWESLGFSLLQVTYAYAKT
jgi:RimJ/RimL family protein N-acetyltransferase